MSVSGLSDKNPLYFYEAAAFPFIQVLQENTAMIRKELEHVLNSEAEDQWSRIFPEYVRSDTDKAWKVFTFLFYRIKYLHHAKRCPQTAELLFNIPEIISADFSFLRANTRIGAHKGFSKMVLRAHLPLIVPEEAKCGIRVGNEVRHWKEGELLIFDDSYEHEAWNDSGKDRVVLMFDIPNPYWGYSAQEIARYKMENLNDPFLLSLATKEQWLTLFEMGEFSL